MSLLNTASPWNNSQPNKRVSSIRKTIKNNRKPDNADEITNTNINESNIQSHTNDFTLTTIEDMQNIKEDRNSKVNDLLNKITELDNDTSENMLGNFTPIEPPMTNLKKDIESVDTTPDYIAAKYNYGDSSNQFKTENTDFANNNNDSMKLNNYSTMYDPPKELSKTPYYSKMGIGNDSLIDKINYMIHMMEEQQNEKTNNITEEFILYTFLGVFIIFVVDSFNRTAKYTR